MNNIFILSIKVLSGLLILTTILLCMNSWAWADDFGMHTNIKQAGGVLQSLVHGYLYWDGRFASPIAILQAFLLLWHIPELASLVWIAFFIGAAVLSLYLIYPDIKTKWYSYVFWFSALLYGVRNHASESIFWVTGGIYIAGMFLLLLWFVYLVKVVNGKVFGSRSIFTLVLLTILSALNGPQVCAAMLSGMSILLLFSDKLFFIRLLFYKRYLPIMVLIVICALVVILAPGNAHRINIVSQDDDKLSIYSVILNAYFVLKVYLYTNSYLFISLPIVSLPIVIWLNSTNSFDKDTFKSQLGIIYACGVMGIASITPFVIYPDFAAPRTSLPFAFCLSIFISWHLILGYSYIIFKYKLIFNSLFNLGLFLQSILLLGLLIFQVKWNISAYKVKELVNSRYNYIQQYQGQYIDLKIPRYSLEIPKIKDFNDIQDDSTHYINHDIAEYYGLRTIQLEDK